MATKECNYEKEKGPSRRLCAGLLIFAFVVLVVFLIIWAILQPKKPRFVLQDATFYAFNVTSAPSLFTSNIQITITSHNPNDRIGIYYDKLHAYATYRNQQITYYSSTPPTYQGHKAVNVWSPFVYGTNVPVAPFNVQALIKDQGHGAIWLTIKLNGRVRWKVGAFVSGRYHLHVSCPAYIPFGKNVAGVQVKYQLEQNCKVDV